MMKSKITIICITYNHISFIRKCLDGFLMQQTNFPFEILIHDDASKDGTAEVLQEYAEKNPNMTVFYEKENQFQRFDFLKYQLFPAVKSEYVALCEGDDYWTDPLKLQKQANYLDAHPECSLCFHPVIMHWENGSEPDSIFPTPNQRFNKTTLVLKDLLKQNFIQTNSAMYRWRFHKDSLDLLPDNILPADWFLHLLHAQVGNIGFIDQVMGVYRRHAGGVWYGSMQSLSWFKKYGLTNIRFYDNMAKSFNFKASRERNILLLGCYTHAKKTADAAWLAELKKLQYPYEMLIFLSIKYYFCTILERITWGGLHKKIQGSKMALKKILY